MVKLKIGIVEDELLIARSIRETLDELGYDFTEPAISYTEAVKMVDEEKPDMLLLDINLSGKKDGIDVAEFVNETHMIPFIFLTANSDAATIERKKVKPHAYLVKPFTKGELFASIEIAFSNYSTVKHSPTEQIEAARIKDAIFIRDNHTFNKILFKDIIYLESSENYVLIYTSDKQKLMVRSTFTDFLTQLPAELFFRTHRSFAVQLGKIEKIEPTEVFAGGNKIPIGKTQGEELYRRLGIN